MMKQVCLTILFLSVFFPLFAQQENILVFGKTFVQSDVLKKELGKNDLQVTNLSSDDLMNINVDQGRLLVIGGDSPIPSESRIAISKYLSDGGNMIVVGSASFDYTPKPKDPVSVVDFGDKNRYRILKPLREPRILSMDAPIIETIMMPSGKSKGLTFHTKERGMQEVFAQFPLNKVSSAARSILSFKAKGNHYIDLLALEIKDTGNRKWISFVPISREWEEYSVSFADFIPEGWDGTGGVYPLLDPATADSLSLGVNLMTVWREKPMAFAIGDVSLCENETGIYAPTASINRLRLPFMENKTTLPIWIVDPFFQSQVIKGNTALISAEGSPFRTLGHKSIPNVSVLANALVEFPGSANGTDTKKSYNHRMEREKRRIKILTTEDGKTVARLDIHAAGIYQNSSIAAFGIQPETVISQPDLLGTLVDVANFVLKKPRVLQTTINTTIQKKDESVVPKFIITLQNPTSQKVQGKLILDIDGMPKKQVNVEIPKSGTSERIIQFGEVPEEFAFNKYNWKITLITPNSSDQIEQLVDVERSMLHAFIHLIETQKKFPDGRYSNHYFGDAYGVRAMFAYLDFLERNPEHLAKNKDLWATISPAIIRESAIRFCDMLVERQLADGALPMGYSEHARGYNIADAGQMVLALAQLSRYVKDEERRKDYLNVCYRFFDWAETYYIDKEKSDSLKVSHPEEYAKGNAKEGLYGLGPSGRSRRETGPSWVLADIIGVQTYLAYIDKNSNSKYKEVADRNVKFYANAQYSAAGYYQAEALFWSWLTTIDKSIKDVIESNLKASFLPPLYRGKLNDMYDLGSRSTLRALPLLYYQRFIENTASNRAVLLKYIWSFGSDDSTSSMYNLSQCFPKPVHGESLAAAKYAALSALWSMELLDPGSTLFEGINLIK